MFLLLVDLYSKLLQSLSRKAFVAMYSVVSPRYIGKHGPWIIGVLILV